MIVMTHWNNMRRNDARRKQTIITLEILFLFQESQLYQFKYDAAGWDYSANTLKIKFDIPKVTRKVGYLRLYYVMKLAGVFYITTNGHVSFKHIPMLL